MGNWLTIYSLVVSRALTHTARCLLATHCLFASPHLYGVMECQGLPQGNWAFISGMSWDFLSHSLESKGPACVCVCSGNLLDLPQTLLILGAIPSPQLLFHFYKKILFHKSSCSFKGICRELFPRLVTKRVFVCFPLHIWLQSRIGIVLVLIIFYLCGRGGYWVWGGSTRSSRSLIRPHPHPVPAPGGLN